MSEDNVHPLYRGLTSRLPGFHRLSPDRRRARLVETRWLSAEDARELGRGASLDEAAADAMVENVIGVHGLPLGVALNFKVNGEDRLIPMAVEEPSIIAACSYAARMVARCGGFQAEADDPIIAAQIQLLDVPDLAAASSRIRAAEPELLAEADRLVPGMRARGGGSRGLEVRELAPDMLCVHVLVDCRDAMGANTVNTVAEGLARRLAELASGRAGLRILTNLCDRRRIRVRARLSTDALASEEWPDGAVVRDAISAAQRFADLDPYRAVTHNKGIMNGVDAVLVACGNDWRAAEAGAHAWAARDGRYRPLGRWWTDGEGDLRGELELPLAASTVGGAARNHPGVRRALKLAGARGATDLALLAGAAGLASNLAALRALSTDGIQRGHMALHARRVAAEAGARGALVDLVASHLARERTYRPDRAIEILGELIAGGQTRRRP